MAEGSDLQDFADGADVDSAVFTLRPDYRVLLLAVDGLAPGAGDASSEALLRRAEETAVALLTDICNAVSVLRQVPVGGRTAPATAAARARAHDRRSTDRGRRRAAGPPPPPRPRGQARYPTHQHEPTVNHPRPGASRPEVHQLARLDHGEAAAVYGTRR